MTDTHDTTRCPHCNALMQEGFVPISDGMHFIRGDGKAASQFAEDIPGTHSIMRTNRLIAWRCKPCQMILFKYGRENAKHVARLFEHEEAAEADAIEAQQAENDQDNQRDG